MDDEQVKEIMVAYDGHIEDMLKWLIEQKLKRYLMGLKYENNKEKLFKTVTELEDSLASLIEKYVKLKNPEKFKTIRVKNEAEDEKMKEDLMKAIQLFMRDDDERD